MKKLLFIASAMLLMANAQLNAQIVTGTVGQGSFTDWSGYTDTRTGLDFNNDGVLEFALKDAETMVSSTQCAMEWSYSDNGNNVWTSGNLDEGGWDEVHAITANTCIGASANWEGQGDAYLVNYYDEALVPLNQDIYVGFRIKLNNNIYYGWGKVKVTGSSTSGYSATWSQIAYNSTPDADILAGQTSDVGVDEYANQALSIYPNPVQNVLFINSRDLIQSVTIYNMEGKMMFNEAMTDGEVNVDELPAGLYMAAVKVNDRLETIKFVKR